VDKIGVKKALKMLGRPIKEIAEAIQRQDAKWLTTLPGVGKQSAEQIIATLRTKVTKFALINPTREPAEGETPSAVVINAQIFEDAYAALMTMGLSPMDARTLLDQVIASGKKCATPEDVINAAFKKGGE
jgi:Holliday junction DNA helicase RuvA